MIDNMLEVAIKEPDDFLKVRETLSRIGVASRKEKKLFQSCHILHKRSRYWILHFKEMFLLDDLESDLSDEDIARRNTIVRLLVEWGLCEAVNPKDYEDPQLSLARLKILSHKDKNEWELVPKYHIGK